jgi:flagellar protein FlgJ
MNLPAVNALPPASHAHAAHLGGAALRAAAPAEQRAAVAAQFEAILVRQLHGKTMTKMLGSGEGAAASVYGDMLTDTLATQLSSGPGLGLGRIIEQQLPPRGAPAAPSDAPAAAQNQAHP